MQTYPTEIAFRPAEEALRYLPEGPYRCPDGRISWVAIQHGAESTTGSLNLLDLARGVNSQYPLPGRPGFAFPTDRPGQFVIGMERDIVLFDTPSGRTVTWISGIDADVSGTIINDGLVYEGHLIFGCKDLNFAEKKAGLYLIRCGEAAAIRLRNDQVCSNGKAIVATTGGGPTLYDICSNSQQVVAHTLDVEAGQLRDTRVVVNLSGGPVFPDGMIATPDERSLIVAIYDPREVDAGEARQYSIATGELEAVWKCPRSSRVTCPQLIERDGAIALLLTTADEGMSAALRSLCPDRGCLFVGPTPFTHLNAAPVFPTPR